MTYKCCSGLGIGLWQILQYSFGGFSSGTAFHLSFFCLILYTLLFGLEITTSNSAPEISVDRGFTTVSSEDSFFPQNEGEPAVPVSSIFFEIPVDKKILNVNFEGRNENHIILNSLLTPVQRNVPFSYKGEVLNERTKEALNKK